MRITWRSGVCTAALLIGAGGVAYAQSSPAPVPPPVRPRKAVTSRGIEEVVVTAQKRAQKSQSVPIVISSFNAKSLAQSGVSNVLELNQFVAGLNIGVGGSSAVTPFLRGVGNDVTTVGNEASTAIYIDDVYIPRLLASFLNLTDVSRIDVLKGPQGTLFGRNSSGGLIDIITKTPSLTEYQAEGSVAYSNYNTTTETLYVSVPLTDRIAADLSVYHSFQGDGWGKNLTTGNPQGYDDPTIIRSKWLYNVTDKLKITAAFDYSYDKNNIGETGNLVAGTTVNFPTFYTQPPYNLPVQKFPSVGFYDTNLGRDNESSELEYGGYVRLDYDMNVAKLSAIGSFREQRENSYIDGDFVPLPTLVFDLQGKTQTETGELQIASEKDSSFDWVGGLYYANEYAGILPTQVRGPALAEQELGGAFGPVLPPTSSLNLYGGQRILDYAEYGQATFHAPDRINITLGARYTIDKVEGRGTTNLNIPGVINANLATAADTKTFYKATWKAAIDHHFTDDVMAYASVSRGFKSGTFNTLPLSIPPARPEVIDAYEVGAKSTLLDHTLQINGALFDYQITDPQVETIVNHQVFISNAGAAQVRGVDLDAQYAVSSNLLTHVSAEYLDAKYTAFSNAPFYFPVNTPPYGNTAPVAGSANGNSLVNAPPLVINGGFNYALQQPFGSFNLNANAAYNSGFHWNPDNIIRQKSYEVVDAALTFTPTAVPSLSVQLYGKNITGAEYATSLLEFAGTGYFYSPAAPAQYGVQLTYKFAAAR
jgi:iron complex outermembrane receptor protein